MADHRYGRSLLSLVIVVAVGCRCGLPSFWLVVDLAVVLVGCFCGCIPNAAPSVNFLVLCVNSALRHYPGGCRGCPAFSLLTNCFWGLISAKSIATFFLN